MPGHSAEKIPNARRYVPANREQYGEQDGFVTIPSDLSTLTKRSASNLIDSLTSNY